MNEDIDELSYYGIFGFTVIIAIIAFITTMIWWFFSI